MKTLLVGIDFSPESAQALKQGLHLATRMGAELHLVHALFQPSIPASLAALPKLADAGHKLDAELSSQAGEKLQALCAKHSTSSLRMQSAVGHGDAAQVLMDAAAQVNADLIVVGTHGRTGFRRLRLGSVAESVAQRAPCSVLVSRADSSDSAGFEQVLVPTDFSDPSEKTLATATQIVTPDGTIRLLHAWINPFEVQALYAGSEQAGEYHEFIEASVQERGNALAQKMREQHPSIVFEQTQGNAAEAILDAMSNHATDLIVVGASTHHLGGVPRATIRHAECSVMVVR